MKEENAFSPKTRKGGCIFSLVKIAALTLVILCVLGYFGMSYIADYALKTLTSGTGVDAGVGSITIGFSDQKCSVNRFYITNPPNYPKGNAIEFKSALVDADVNFGDLLSKRLVHVEEINVDGLKISYDAKTQKGLAAFVNTPDNNLNDIVKAIMGNKSAASDKQPADAADADAQTQSKPFRFIIDKLVFADGDAKVSFNGKIIDIKLPSFTMQNIGGTEGFEMSELTGEILKRLVKKITVDIATQLANDGLKSGEKAGSDVKTSVENALKELFK